MEEGTASLSTNELHDLFSHAASLRELHSWNWSTGSSGALNIALDT
jgi:hypothetical protein